MQLFDKETGQWIEAPEQEVFGAIQSGRYDIAKGQYYVRDSRGDAYPVDAGALPDALSRGYKLETSQESAEREYGDRDLAAAGAAGLRAMTFGLSDQVLTGMDIVDPETLSGLREGNPTLSTGAEIGGLLAGGFSGALGKAAQKGTTAMGVQALKAVSTPARVVTSLGRATSQRVEGKILQMLTTKGFKGAGSRIAARTAAEAAAGVVEGSLYGVGQVITEEALGDTPTVAEALTAYVGPAALFGAAGGGLFGMGGALTTEAMSATKVAVNRLKGYAKGKETAVEKGFREGDVFEHFGLAKPPKKFKGKSPSEVAATRKEIAEVLTDDSVMPDGPILKSTMLPEEGIERLHQASRAYGEGIGHTVNDIDNLIQSAGGHPSSFVP